MFGCKVSVLDLSAVSLIVLLSSVLQLNHSWPQRARLILHVGLRWCRVRLQSCVRPCFGGSWAKSVINGQLEVRKYDVINEEMKGKKRQKEVSSRVRVVSHRIVLHCIMGIVGTVFQPQNLGIITLYMSTLTTTAKYVTQRGVHNFLTSGQSLISTFPETHNKDCWLFQYHCCQVKSLCHPKLVFLSILRHNVQINPLNLTINSLSGS